MQTYMLLGWLQSHRVHIKQSTEATSSKGTEARSSKGKRSL